MKKIFATMLLAAATFAVHAQNNKDNGVPQQIRLAKPEDYTQYKKNVLQCINWLMDTPYDPASEQQRAANAFLMQWVAGSPDVKVVLAPGVMNFLEANPNLLTIFMGGWTRYALEQSQPEDKLNGNLKGVESVIRYYEKNREKLKQDKQVEAYAEMQQKKTLKSYIEAHLQ